MQLIRTTAQNIVFGCILGLSVLPLLCRGGEGAELRMIEKAPPAQLAPEIREALQPTAIQLSEDGKPFYEFWFRRQLPLAKTPPAGTFALMGLREGTVVGAVKVYQERYDFKDEEIPPGVYVMRFALQPQDGDHMGTSPTRTFVLLVPAADDRKLEGLLDHDAVVEASSVVNAAEHPSNLNLQPVTDSGGSFPRLAVHHGGRHHVVYVQVPAVVETTKRKLTLTFALVYKGMGEL